MFTSARSHGRDGYHLVAASPGVTSPDARELAVWGPTHDSLNNHCPAFGSINYFRLPSEAYCVSRTIAAGSEYSNRGGNRVNTQYFVVPPSVMSRFAYDPFRIIDAANASGKLDVLDEIPEKLQPFRLVGRASSFDMELLQRLNTDLGPRVLVGLVQAAMSTELLCILGGPPPEHVMAGLISLFPPLYRRELTLSTGLRFSSRRPFRLMTLEPDPGLERRLAQRSNTVVINISGNGSQLNTAFGPWAEFLLDVIRNGHWHKLVHLYSDVGEETDSFDMDEIAMRISCETGPPSRENVDGRQTRRSCSSARSHGQSQPESGHAGTLSKSRVHRAVAPLEESRVQSVIAAAEVQRNDEFPSSALLDLEHTTLMEKLEELDGAVLDAINGVDGAIQRLTTLWPEITSVLTPRLVDERRGQYVQFAIRRWRNSGPERGIRKMERAVAALEVLSLLFGEE